MKHRRLYKDIGWHTYEPMLSPLYRLRKVNDDEMTEEDTKLLEIKNLSVEYHTDDADIYAINNINLSINKGETLGLVG